MSGRVLIIDDTALRPAPSVPAHRAARVAVVSALRRQGYLVSTCHHPTDVAGALGRIEPEVVIVDPDDNATHDLLQLVRRHSRAAILLVTGRGASPLQARAADDCLRRPFAMVDLIARVRALTRRVGPQQSGRVVVDGLEIVGEAARVVHHGHAIDLTRTERRVLAFLAARSRQIVGKRELLLGVWGSDTGDANVVEVNVSTLRRKLERHGPRVIHTIRGRGYRLGAAYPVEASRS